MGHGPFCVRTARTRQHNHPGAERTMARSHILPHPIFPPPARSHMLLVQTHPDAERAMARSHIPPFPSFTSTHD